MRRIHRGLALPPALLVASLLALGGCSLAPSYEPPTSAVPATWRATFEPAGDARWKPATPADAVPRGAWWTLFDDPALDALMLAVNGANQDLALAAARLRESRAARALADASRRPRVDVSAGAARGQPSQVAPGLPDGIDIPAYEVYRAGFAASWDTDLFGRLADGARAAAADVEAEAALAESTRLAVQAEAARSYFLLRQAEAELVVERRSIQTREEAVALLTARLAAGDISELDVARTQAELDAARADAIALERAIGQYRHALAELAGTTPAGFDLAAGALPAQLPHVPPALPSVLLERRPDIAAAERRVMAATARIGVARAAFFPVLNLTAQFGAEASELGNLFQWSSRTWALGPLSGALLLAPVFDSGRNAANLEASYARLDADIARYRRAVLGAFREVEDALVALETLARQAAAVAAALTAAERAYAVAGERHAAGQTGYLDVLDARRTLVTVRRAEARLTGERALATVALLRALGGGWQAGEEPSALP